MRHAYLIIAHNEPEVLKYLVSSLDDDRNDIFIHFDKKVNVIPELSTERSGLHILEKRVDVRWGSVSQIKCEYALFETAAAYGPYDYYHLISGVHLPLKSVDVIDDYYSSVSGKAVLCGFTKDIEYQETLKLRRINLFLRGFASKDKTLRTSSQFLWKSFIAVQRLLGITINKNRSFYKAANWLSLPEDAMSYVLSCKEEVLKTYRFSLCGDEFFVPSLLMDSIFKDKIVDSDILLKVDMQRANPVSYHISAWEGMKGSPYLFARKFSTDSSKCHE